MIVDIIFGHEPIIESVIYYFIQFEYSLGGGMVLCVPFGEKYGAYFKDSECEKGEFNSSSIF